MLKPSVLLVTFSLFFLSASVHSQDLSKTLPVDPNLTVGKLDNGITYYIRYNKKPEKRAELRLAVNAGSVLENDDQQGLAHFVEHMGFNGTKNFKKQELINYLESVGMKFGPEVNAYTSFDETVYMLTIPTDSAAIVDKAFDILEDWSHLVSFEDEEIDKERGVIIEEWRLRRGAEARMQDKQFPILFKNSRYAERLPIGKKEILESFKHETLRRFYNDWYRPDLTAVIAVGDFDKAKIESLIKKHFSAIALSIDKRERVTFPVPNHKEPLFAIATDPEATMSRVGVYYKHEVKPEKTVSDYRRNIIQRLYDGMLNNRLYELTKQPEPPFTFGYSQGGRFIRSKEFYVLFAGVKNNGIDRGLDALLVEAARVRKFGFTQTELEREKKDALRGMEQAFNEREKTESSNYAREYVSNYLQGEPIPGIVFEYEQYKALLPGITLADVNKLASELITEENRVVMVNAPQKTDVKVPTEAELVKVFEAAVKKPLQAYDDKVTSQPLVATPPKPGEIVGRKEIKEIGVTEWTLSNGIRVVLKPTDFKNDEVLFSAWSPGGTSLVADKDYTPASFASTLMMEGGVAQFDQIALQKMLSGKIVNVMPTLSELSEGFQGSASPADLETMFQVIYLYATAPRMDNSAYESFKTRMKANLQNRSAMPEVAFEDTVNVTMAQHHYRRRPMTEERLNELNLQTSFKIYKERFADMGDFTFFIVGSFDLTKIEPFVKTYLASLPAIKRNERWKDIGVEMPEGKIEKTVKKGIEPKSQVRIIFSGPFEYSQPNRFTLQSLASVLRIKLREQLREEKGGVYGIGVGATPSNYPKQEYRMTISFGCAPERVEELTKVTLEQIDSLKKFGIDPSYVNKVKEQQRRERETSLKENRFWLSSFMLLYTNNEDPLNILNTPKLTEGLSVETVQAAAKKYFDDKNYARFVMYPQEK